MIVIGLNSVTRHVGKEFLVLILNMHATLENLHKGIIHDELLAPKVGSSMSYFSLCCALLFNGNIRADRMAPFVVTQLPGCYH